MVNVEAYDIPSREELDGLEKEFRGNTSRTAKAVLRTVAEVRRCWELLDLRAQSIQDLHVKLADVAGDAFHHQEKARDLSIRYAECIEENVFVRDLLYRNRWGNTDVGGDFCVECGGFPLPNNGEQHEPHCAIAQLFDLPTRSQ